jgi:hypothetical protein
MSCFGYDCGWRVESTATLDRTFAASRGFRHPFARNIPLLCELLESHSYRSAFSLQDSCETKSRANTRNSAACPRLPSLAISSRHGLSSVNGKKRVSCEASLPAGFRTQEGGGKSASSKRFRMDRRLRAELLDGGLALLGGAEGQS